MFEVVVSIEKIDKQVSNRRSGSRIRQVRPRGPDGWRPFS